MGVFFTFWQCTVYLPVDRRIQSGEGAGQHMKREKREEKSEIHIFRRATFLSVFTEEP